MQRTSRSAIAALLLVAIATAMLCVSGTASAVVGRGHEFATSIGETGSGDGQFKEPSSVAVSEVGKDAGDIYVSDRGNNRIVQLGPKGEFLAAWGFGVTNGANEYQVCKSSCKAGLPNTGNGLEKFKVGGGQLRTPGEVAVDNSRDANDPSAGDVYVVADVAKEKSFVNKYGPDGEYLGRVTRKEESEEHGLPVGVAVDPHGIVYVGWREEGSISYFANGTKNKRIGEEEAFLPEPEPEMAPGRGRQLPRRHLHELRTGAAVSGLGIAGVGRIALRRRIPRRKRRRTVRNPAPLLHREIRHGRRRRPAGRTR